MFTKKEIVWIIIASLILGFIIEFTSELTLSIYGFLIAPIIILINIISKKISSNYFNIKIEHKIWKFQRFGFYERSKFKKPFPIGLILPFFLTIVSLSLIKPLTLLQFDAKNLPKKRVLRKRGSYRHSEINESDLAFTSAWGFWALILLAIIGAIIKQPQLTAYPIYYGLWNLIPISNLDGTKLFFGSLINWILLVIVYIVSLVVILV